MEEKNLKKERIVFETKSSIVEIALSILKENQLKESSLDALDRMINDKRTKKNIIIQGARDLFSKRISENNLKEELKEEFKVDEETAKKILKGIKEKLVSKAKVIDESKEEKKEELALEELVEKERNKKNTSDKKDTKKSVPQKPKQEKPSQKNKGPDDYREPIE